MKHQLAKFTKLTDDLNNTYPYWICICGFATTNGTFIEIHWLHYREQEPHKHK